MSCGLIKLRLKCSAEMIIVTFEEKEVTGSKPQNTIPTVNCRDDSMLCGCFASEETGSFHKIDVFIRN